jgi:hypothetical protein
MEEIWKDIDGYEGRYQISNYGKIKNTFNNVEIKQSLSTQKYFKSCLEYKTVYIHRLVALAFVDKIPNKPFVNHMDGNNQNNIASNLEWVNPRENMCHRYINKKRTSNFIGVDFNMGKYRSTIRFAKKQIHLGRYDTELEAYQARVNYEKENNIENKYL